MKYIFSWPEGKEIKSVTELQNGRYYVCASVNRLTRVNYGNSREQFWKGGKLQHDESHLFTKKNGSVRNQRTSKERDGRFAPTVSRQFNSIQFISIQWSVCVPTLSKERTKERERESVYVY